MHKAYICTSLNIKLHVINGQIERLLFHLKAYRKYYNIFYNTLEDKNYVLLV